MGILKLQRNSIAGNKYEKIYFVTVCSALVFYLIGYGIFSSFSHNVIPSDTGIISKFTLSARIKVPTFVVIILLTLCIGLGAIFGFYLSSLNAFFNSKLSNRILNLSRRTLHAILILGLCLIASFKNPGAVMTDYFHDGERLAFLNSLSKLEDIFTTSIFIHGLSNNFFPLALGSYVFGEKSIIGFRLILVVQQLLSYLTVYFLIQTILKIFEFHRYEVFVSTLLFLNIVYLGDPYLVILGKDLILFMVILSFFQFIHCDNKWLLWLWGILIGFLVVFGLFYTMNRGLYGSFYISIMCIVFAFYDIKKFSLFFKSILVGIFFAALTFIALFGPNIFIEVYNIYDYWVDNAKVIWGNPLLKISTPQIFMAWVALFIYLVLAMACTAYILSYFMLDSKKTISVKHKMALFGLLFFAPIFANDFLSRFYFGKIVEASVPLFFTSLILVLIHCRNDLCKWISAIKLRGMPIIGVLVLLLTITICTKSLVIVQTYIGASKKENMELIEADYSKAINVLKKLTIDSTCFYTLTSEGIWYHALDIKPCSRFPILAYARSTEAQLLVISDLRENTPDFLLYDNRGWSNNIDGINIKAAVPLVIEFVHQNYEKLMNIESHEIWVKKLPSSL